MSRLYDLSSKDRNRQSLLVIKLYFDVLKQFQNEVNDIRSERLARSANPLALLAAAQPYSDNYYQAPKPQRSNAPSYMQSSSTRPNEQDTDEEIDEQELEAHYSFMAKIQEVLPEESSSTDQPLEQDDSNVTPDSSNICNNDNQVDQNAVEYVDERVALANLIANLALDTKENKTILKQLKKANASLTQELKECN
ncbi:hypothetical protein Tco_0174845 [Tanacetum coccineum]